MRKGIAVHAREIKGMAFGLLALFACGFVSAGGTCPEPAAAGRGSWPVWAQDVPTSAHEKVRAVKYEIDVAFEPERGFLHAKAAVTVLVLQKVDAVEFELNPKLAISEVTDAQGRKLEFTRSGRIGSAKLLVRLAEPVAAGDCRGGPTPAVSQVEGCLPDPRGPVTDKPGLKTITLTFTYEGVPLPKPLDYITKDGILLRDESRWYPAVDLSAFTENVLVLRLPAGWEAVASGSLQDRRQNATSTELHWEASPAVSSRSIAAAPSHLWKCNASPGSPVHWPATMTYFLYGCFAPSHWPQGCCRTEFFSAFDRIFESSVWPFSTLGGPRHKPSINDLLHPTDTQQGQALRKEFSIVQGFPGQRGVTGYSAPGFLVVSEDVVKHHGDPGFPPEFLPHEIAHQWFPIEVTLKSEADGWLAESLAEYLAWRYLAEKEPEQARQMVARAMREATVQEPLRPLALGLRMFALEDWDVTHAALYERGMLVWRTLETVIDRERVDRALREYYKRYRGQSASIDDFRRICEEISGRDLKWFFDYYITGMRLPEIEIRRLPGTAPGEFAGEIVVRNVPPEFQVRVEMALQTAKGVVEHSVATRGEVTPFTANVPDTVTRMILDPRQRILRKTQVAPRQP